MCRPQYSQLLCLLSAELSLIRDSTLQGRDLVPELLVFNKPIPCFGSGSRCFLNGNQLPRGGVLQQVQVQGVSVSVVLFLVASPPECVIGEEILEMNEMKRLAVSASFEKKCFSPPARAGTGILAHVLLPHTCAKLVATR